MVPPANGGTVEEDRIRTTQTCISYASMAGGLEPIKQVIRNYASRAARSRIWPEEGKGMVADPKDLLLGKGLTAYRDVFGAYLRLVDATTGASVDLDERQAYHLLKVLHIDMDRLAAAALTGPFPPAEPNYKCLTEGCQNRITEITGHNGYCEVHHDRSREEELKQQ